MFVKIVLPHKECELDKHVYCWSHFFFSVKNMGKITYEGNWFLLFSRHITAKVTSTDVSINNNRGTNRGHGYEIATMIKYKKKYTLFQKDSELIWHIILSF